jgi:hypothetical protein
MVREEFRPRDLRSSSPRLEHWESTRQPHCGHRRRHNKFIVGAGTTQLYGKSQNLMTQANNTLAKYYALANGDYLSPPVAAGTETPGSRNTYATAFNSHNHASYVQNIGSDLFIRGQKASTTWNYNLMVAPGDGKGDLLSRDAAGVLWLHPRRRGCLHQARHAHQGTVVLMRALRPFTHSWPVQRLMPTIRLASLMLTPWPTSSRNFCRSPTRERPGAVFFETIAFPGSGCCDDH